MTQTKGTNITASFIVLLRVLLEVLFFGDAYEYFNCQ